MVRHANVVDFTRVRRPRTFTSNEQVIDEVRNYIFSCGKTYANIAQEAGVSATTVRKLASGDTRWPRHTTLFPVMEAVGCGLMVVSVTRKVK